jgi:hypothetical protein
MIKTFRGLLADGDIETIRLGTNNGLIGYKIKVFDLMPNNPWTQDYESFVQLFTVKPDTAPGVADFSNSLLLGAAMWSSKEAGEYYPEDKHIVFDNIAINQDIYVTFKDTKSNDGMNFYLELEQIKLDLNEATVSTLKDMRGTE